MKATIRILAAALVAAAVAVSAESAFAQIKINEIRTDQSGTDTDEYFELIGPPGASLAGLTYIVLGDTGTVNTCGFIESIVNLGSFSIQADGLLCLRNSNSPGPVLTGYDGAVSMFFENTDNVTHLLVTGFTGTLYQKLDTDDDGVLEVTPWTGVVDCLGLQKGTVPNCAGEEHLYCATEIGPDGSFVPSHVYRFADTQAWALGDFSPLGNTDTPGEPNHPAAFVDMTRDPCVPLTGQPATVVVVVRNNPTSAELRYTVNGGAETVVEMEVYGTAHDTVFYFAQIPAQAANGSLIEYYCNAYSGGPIPSRSYDQGYFVGTMNIADLRVNDVNGSNLYRYYGARVRGHVTAAYDVFSAANTDYHVQDATGGINVFKFGPHSVQPALGDDITVVGTVDQYAGKLELAGGGSCDTVLVTIHGSGTPPAPLTLSLCDLREQHEGLLVRVEDLVINPDGHLTFAGNYNYHAANCFQDSLEMRIDADTDIPGHTIVQNHMHVVGIAGQFDGSPPYTWWYQVMPRAMTDITFPGPTDVPVPATTGEAWLWAGSPNPFDRSVEIRYQVPAAAAGAAAPHVRLAVFDLRGRAVATLVNGPVPPGIHVATLRREALALRGSGIVFCRLEVGGTVLSRKLVMMRQ